MDSVDLIRAAPAGWWVAVDGKRPLHKWRDAPPDHGEVADHLHHGAGLAVMPASLGLMVVNSDIRGESVESDEVFARSDSTLGKPGAWHGSPGGGRHLWYRSGTPFACKPLKLAGKHVGELRCAGVLATVHKPAVVGRVLRHYADLYDIADRVPAFMALFDPPPAREVPSWRCRPVPVSDRPDHAPITVGDWRDALPDLRRVGPGEWAGPCPLCGGTDRFRVTRTGANCRCLPDNGNGPRFAELVRIVFGEARDE